jgi:hypothetical protein
MNDQYRLVPDGAPPSQLTLELEVRLDVVTTVQELAPGERFLLEACQVEGRVVSCGPSAAVVAIRGPDDHWTQTRWSLQTEVRRLRA